MAEGRTDDPRVGKILQGRYPIVERLASGGMGVVYRAERVGAGSRRGGRVPPGLGGAGCVGIIDFGIEQDSPYLVMDFARGKTLRATLDAVELPRWRNQIAGDFRGHRPTARICIYPQTGYY